MSVIEVLHDVAISTIKKGKKVKSDEYVIKGEKGLTIKYFFQDYMPNNLKFFLGS